MDKKEIIQLFYEHRNPLESESMAAYMKNHFLFLGIKKPSRALLQKEWLKQVKKESTIDWEFIFELFQLEYREFQYLAIDYLNAVKKHLVENDLDHLLKLVVIKSWWDSVDLLSQIIGYLVYQFPDLKSSKMEGLKTDENMWLRRVAILFQLKYKENLDTQFLSDVILKNLDTNAFFINKAIGWSLREYSKTNNEWVIQFLKKHQDQLSNLSVKEASKYIVIKGDV